jgi:hypothetical protein
MTHDTNQIFIGADAAVQHWLKDRFGIDATKHYLGTAIIFKPLERDTALTMQVEFFVGADDLRAFPDPTKLPKAAA